MLATQKKTLPNNNVGWFQFGCICILIMIPMNGGIKDIGDTFLGVNLLLLSL